MTLAASSHYRPTPATALNAIARVFTSDQDWQPLTERFRLAAEVVRSLEQAGYVIQPDRRAVDDA